MVSPPVQGPQLYASIDARAKPRGAGSAAPPWAPRALSTAIVYRALFYSARKKKGLCATPFNSTPNGAPPLPRSRGRGVWQRGDGQRFGRIQRSRKSPRHAWCAEGDSRARVAPPAHGLRALAVYVPAKGCQKLEMPLRRSRRFPPEAYRARGSGARGWRRGAATAEELPGTLTAVRARTAAQRTPKRLPCGYPICWTIIGVAPPMGVKEPAGKLPLPPTPAKPAFPTSGLGDGAACAP